MEEKSSKGYWTQLWVQPLAQEIAKAQITGAEKMEIAFCPWAVLAFRAWASKTRQFQRQEKRLDRRLFWPCATNFMFQHVVWQTYQHFFIGEDFSSSRIKTKGCIIREIELKKHCEVFLLMFQSYTTIWWISGLSHCLWKKDALSQMFCCVLQNTNIQTDKTPPKPGGMMKRRGWFLTYPSTLTLPLSNLAQRDS